MDGLIHIVGLGKRYSLFSGWALRNVNLTISRNEVYGLVGENGAGKTTLIRILLHLVSPSRGRISLSQGIRLGYVPEQPAFHNTLKVGEHLNLVGGICGLWGRSLRRRVDEVLEIVDLWPQTGNRINTLSKGMLQRLGIAQAILDEPDLIIMDEPAGGLDPLGQKEIRDLILLLNQQGKTILFSSHYLTEIERVCHRVGILHKGELVLDASIHDLIHERKENVEVGTDAPEARLREVFQGTGLGVNITGSRIQIPNLNDEDYFIMAKTLHDRCIRILELKTQGNFLEKIFLDATKDRRDS